MSPPDLINGIFETCGGFFIALSVAKLHREKVVKGVSWMHVAFFTAWGFWNLFFYPHLGQWFSFAGGLALVAVNVVWLAQIIYYNNLRIITPSVLRRLGYAVAFLAVFAGGLFASEILRIWVDNQ